MKRLAMIVAGCMIGGAVAPVAMGAPPPPPTPPRPVSLTLARAGSDLIVVVKCKDLTKRNAKYGVALDVQTRSPKAEYGVQSNGPGMPVAVHPYGGNGSTTGSARFTVSITHQTETFKFALRAIRNPAKVMVRAIQNGNVNVATRFYSLTL